MSDHGKFLKKEKENKSDQNTHNHCWHESSRTSEGTSYIDASDTLVSSPGYTTKFVFCCHCGERSLSWTVIDGEIIVV